MSDVWNQHPGMLERLRALWADPGSGSSSAIADTLNREYKTNVSRSAVCGKIFRLNITKRKAGPAHFGMPAQAAKIARPAPVRVAARVVPKLAAQPPLPSAPPAVLRKGAARKFPDGVHLQDLRPGFAQCRWPMWGDRDQPSLIFCGEDLAIGPYCAEHAQRSYSSNQARQQAHRSMPARQGQAAA